MNKKVILNFWKHPITWLFFKITQSNLPLMWRVQAAAWSMKWWQYKRHFKDQLLGELVVVVVSVDKDWEYVQGKYTQTRVRDIVYRWKRTKLPFTYFKYFRGTQCSDETAFPLNRLPHSDIAKVSDQIFEYNQDVKRINEQDANHQKLKDSIVDHKFQEYDHDL